VEISGAGYARRLFHERDAPHASNNTMYMCKVIRFVNGRTAVCVCVYIRTCVCVRDSLARGPHVKFFHLGFRARRRPSFLLRVARRASGLVHTVFRRRRPAVVVCYTLVVGPDDSVVSRQHCRPSICFSSPNIFSTSVKRDVPPLK